MELRRFYVQPNDVMENYITITGNEYRHMTGVLRFRVGYKAIVCDNSGKDYYCTVESIDARQAICRVDSVQNNDAELRCPPVLCMGLIKPEKMEIAIQKAVELGVNAIQPFTSDHTAEITWRADRMERIVLEACKQCGRAVLPVVQQPVRFANLFGADVEVWMAYEKERGLLLRDCVAKNYQKGKPIRVIVGPEGGFSQAEADFARANGAHLFGLGKRIMRAETAAIVSLGTIIALTEEV